MSKKIAVLTSGGDSPGMNCAIRSIVRTAIGNGYEVLGIERGYAGLLKEKFVNLTASSVGNIIQRGGTILRSSRCPEFLDKDVRAKAADILKKLDIEALIVIGGDGSFKGGIALYKEFGIPTIGIPGTIDNDLSGTEYTLGFDTAVQTAIEAVDKIRDTADANDRTFLIEVMGARSSSIALKVGLCTGAEAVLLNEDNIDYNEVATSIKRGMERGKNSSILIVAEGKKPGRCYGIADMLEEQHQISSKVCVLGHIQRGGSPTANDRFFGSLMGHKAIECIKNGEFNKGIVVRENKVIAIDIEECSSKSDHVMREYIGVAEELSI